MEENELEEGEAFSGKEEGEDDGGAPIDPDIALSYIDEKLQNVLGHFQKDFEGGVCAENLGAKFGGYGSFLPTYQRSPSVLSQARSPHVAGGSFNGVNPSCFSLPEASPQNNNILPTQSTSDNKTASHTSSNPSNKDAAPRKASSNQEFTPQHDTVSRSSNGSDQRPLKVRIKVGPESAPPRKNAAIYSRLGFDISPVSSPEDSPEGSGELFTGGHDSPDTPLTTFKFYSGLLATHLVACLLSPIHGDMLFMAEKKAPIKKEFNMEDNVSPKNDKSYGKNRKSSSDKGSKFSELDPSTKSGGNDVSGAVNRADAKPSIKKERIVNTLSPSLPVHPKYDYENLVRPPICERSKDSSAYRRPEKIAANEGKLSPGRVDKDPPGISKFGNGSAVGSKQKPSIESSSDEKILPNGGSNTYKDPKKFVKANNDDRISAIVKAESDGYAETDDLPVGPPESIKLRAPQRAISYEEVRGDVQEKDVSVGKKKKSKGSKSSSRQSKDKNKDYSNATSTAPLKEKKSNAVPTGEKDSKLNASKSEKDPNRKVSKGSTNYTPIVKVDHEDNRIKLGDARLDYQGGSAMPGDRMKERMVHKKTENPLLFQAEKGSAAAPVTGNEPGFEVAPPSADCWVQCDKCQKWRLCPPGVTPNDLPDKWLCNMLDWLPGMNRCSVSEEETTQALLAPYQPLAPLGQVAVDPVHYAASASGITSKDARQLNPDLTKANHTSVKSKKPSDVNPLSLEPTQHNRGNLYHGDNPSYLYAGKQKHKHAEKKERQEHYFKKGDSIEKGSKSMKSKTRKEFDQDGSRNSKKLKSAEFSNVKNDWHFNSNSSGERDFGATNDRSPEVSAKYRKKNSSPMDSRRSKLQLSGEIAKVPHRTSENSEVKEDYSNISDNSKKRKMKQLHGSRDQPIADVGTETQKEITESLIRTEKKPRASKFHIRDPNESKLSFESERHKPMSGTPLSGSRDEFHLQNAHDKHQQDADHMYQFSQRNANNVDHLKRDMGFSQTSTAATSSSSKISGSCRSKTNFQEVRGSPVESVSSSPLRTSATGKLTRRVDDTRNVDTFSKGSTGEYFSDIDGAYHQKQKASSAVRGGSLDCGKVPESRTMDPVDSVSNLTGKKTGPPAESKAQNILLSLFGHTDDEHSSEYEDTNVDASAVVTSEPPNNVSSEVQIRSHGDDLKLSRPDERNSQKMFSNNSGRNKEKHRNPEVDVSDEKRKFPAAESDQRDRNPAANNDAHGRSTHESSRSDKYNLEKIKKKNSSTKISGERTKDAKNVNLPNFAPENYDVSGSTLPAEKHRSSYSNVAGSSIASGNGEKSYFNEKVQDAIYKEDRGAPSLSRSDRMEKLNKSSGKSKKPETSLPLEDEQGGHDIVPQSVSTTAKESYPIPLTEKTLSSTPVSALKGASSKSGNRNETKSSSLMQLTPSRLDITTSKRDANVSVSSVLKEATDLKHTANRKKNEGLDHESTGLYFQAALKFLYGASLIERSNSESTKHGDPIQWYFQTAKLCEFCAHEYERRKEMSAAALAYKCVEVAYMKSVFLKNGVAAKDRIELQNAPQIGESPSSSASDVDNVNNQGALDKVAPDKKNNPLQGRHPGGGFVIPSRNRSSFSRILAFAEATNGAMEASKKSIHTLSCASSTVSEDSKKGVEGLFLVQRTLDFSFHDIEGLLRLVRQAMELINS